VRPIAGGGNLPEATVARYVAKYATKAAEAAGVDLGPIACRSCAGRGTRPGTPVMVCPRCGGTGRRPGVSLRHLTGHARALVSTCWWLGRQPAFAELRLRCYAHMLGFRGHFATKSRSYSTTMAALRAERRQWTAAGWAHRFGVDPAGVLVVGDWRYAGPDGGWGSA